MDFDVNSLPQEIQDSYAAEYSEQTHVKVSELEALREKLQKCLPTLTGGQARRAQRQIQQLDSANYSWLGVENPECLHKLSSTAGSTRLHRRLTARPKIKRKNIGSDNARQYVSGNALSQFGKGSFDKVCISPPERMMKVIPRIRSETDYQVFAQGVRSTPRTADLFSVLMKRDAQTLKKETF